MRKKCSLKELNEKLRIFLEEETSTIEDIFGNLSEIVPDGLTGAYNNKVYLKLENGKLLGFRSATWTGEKFIDVELDPEKCKDKETLLKELKDLGVFHPETIDIVRSKIEPGVDFIILDGLVDKNNPKIKIVTQAGGRGTVDTILRNSSGNELKDAIMDLGYNVNSCETIKETSMGTLVSCKIYPYNTVKAFLVKDGKAKNASVVTLLKLIKEV